MEQKDGIQKKVKNLKLAVRNLMKAQEELRLARAKYNKAVSEVIEDD